MLLQFLSQPYRAVCTTVYVVCSCVLHLFPKNAQILSILQLNLLILILLLSESA